MAVAEAADTPSSSAIALVLAGSSRPSFHTALR